MAGATKKVILRTLAGSIHPGYLSAGGFVEDRLRGLGQADARPTVPLLDLDSRVVPIALSNVRFIAFVRDWNLADPADPERLSRRTFPARPRTEGLWMRLTFSDGDILEGLAPLDLALADGLVEDRGIFLIPPDIRSNTQRLYVPRSALSRLETLAVITNPSKAKPPHTSTQGAQAQDSLFPIPPVVDL